MAYLQMTDLDLANKRVLIRQDLNVPIKDGQVTSDARIRASLPSIQAAAKAGAKVLLMSHLGRPEEGVQDEKNSLAPVAQHLSQLLGQPVRLIRQYLDLEVIDLEPGEVVLLENVRFNPGEKADADSLAQAYAALCDIYVMDAFGTAHRAQASTHGVARFAPLACAGPLLAAELSALTKALSDPRPPVVAIVGGSKVSTKLEVLNELSQKCDQLIVGGGIANTFLAAAGHQIGKSLYEKDLLDQARGLMAKVDIPLPVDVVVATEFSDQAATRTIAVDQVKEDEMILDVGPETAKQQAEILKNAGTLLWNGPVGVFELAPFAAGTQALALAIAESQAFSVAGGGDTLAAIDAFGVADQISYISTGGGAFLEFLEGKQLPAVHQLELRAQAASNQ